MRTRRGVLGCPLYVPLLMVALAFQGRAEAALATSHLPNAAGALAIVNANGGAVRVTAESRIGGNNFWELGLRRDPLNLTDGTLATANFDAWLNGVPIPFVMTYDGRNRVTMTLVLSTVINGPSFSVVNDFNEILIPTRAAGAHTSIVVGNLFLNGQPIAGSASAIHTGTDAQDVLRIQGASLSRGFLLAGTITLRWQGAKPTGSALDAQVWLAKVAAAASDATPPTVAILSPAAGSLLATSAPTLSASFSDSGTGIDPSSVHLLFDGVDRTSEAEVGASGLTFTPSEILGEGLHTGTVIVRDLATNEARADVSFTTDTLPPEVTFPSPGATVFDDATPQIAVSFSDSTSGIDPGTLLISLDGRDLTSSCSLGSGLATCTPPPLAKGAHTVNARVADRAGNGAIASTAFDVDLDVAPPALAIVEPQGALVVGNPTPGIRVEYSDARSGVDASSLHIAIDGTDLVGSCVVEPAFATCTPLALLSGPHTVTAQVADMRGNSASAEVFFTLSLPLSITLAEPRAESIVGVPVVRILGTVSPQARSVKVNGIDATLQSGTFAIQEFGLHNGVNDLVAVAVDDAGNTGTATVRVTADITPPAVSVSAPLEGAVLSSPEITVSGRVNDLTIGTVSETEVTVTVDGRLATVVNRGFLAPRVPLSPGANTLQVVATDRVGNHTAVQVHVTYEPPPSGPAIQALSGDGQSAPILSALPEPLRVKVVDAAGQPVPNLRVVFRVVQGSGRLGSGKRGEAVSTDAQGVAAATLTLGSRAGAATDRVRATATGIRGEALFYASASPGPAAAINVVSGDAQAGAAGTLLSRPFIAVLTDREQNPIVGAEVTFQVKKGVGHFADGSDSVVAQTDASGLALAPLTLGTEEGWDGNEVAASFEGMETLPATFRASAFVPGDPQATRITGVVLDNQGEPVPGVTLRLRNSTLTAVTNEQGAFQLAGVPVGQVFLIADASTATRPGSWASLEFELFAVSGIENSLPKPIYILPLDLSHGITVDETRGGTLTLPGIPGFSLEIAPGSVTFPTGSRSGVVSVTAVHADKIPMAPGAGMQPRLIVTLQPAGARFDPPAAITFPNVDGLPPGTVTELFSFDHHIGAFVSIGTGTVSEDGRVLRSDPGFGVVEAGWHCGSRQSANGASAVLKVEIITEKPIVLLANPGSPDHRIIGAQGEPSLDAEYSWKISDKSIVDLNPIGDNLCSDSHFCNTLATSGVAGTATATIVMKCKPTGITKDDSVKIYVAKVRDVIVHPSDPETSKVASVLPPASDTLLHFVTAIDQGDIVLKADIVPDEPEVRDLITWDTPTGIPLTSPAVGSDKSTVKLSSALPQGFKVPINLRIKGKLARKLVVWVVSADMSGQVSGSVVTPRLSGQFRIGTLVTFEITPQAAIYPPTIIKDGDRPDLQGANTITAPGGVNSCNAALSGGAVKRWDTSRRVAIRASTNPAGLHVECVDNAIDRPADLIIGNDDASIADPEDNDPYSAPGVGFLIGHDDPHREGPGNGLMKNGDVGNTFGSQSWFSEFARLQLDQRWFVLSGDLDWRVDFRYKKVAVTEVLWNIDANKDGALSGDIMEANIGGGTDLNGDGDLNDVVGFWDDAGSVSANDNAGRP